jgi:hypothetical protein
LRIVCRHGLGRLRALEAPERARRYGATTREGLRNQRLVGLNRPTSKADSLDRPYASQETPSWG